MIIQHVGQRIISIGGPQIATPRGAAAVSWWLSGGISAANCIAAYQSKGAASYVASKVNLANPGTYDATEGTAPSWASGTGWTFDGSSQYLTTGILPASGWSMLIQYTSTRGSAAYDNVCGCYDGAGKYFLLLPISVSGVYYGAGGVVIVNPAIVAGNLGVAGQQGYRNGVANGGYIGAWSGATTKTVYIGNRNALDAWFKGNVAAFAVYNTTLTAPQVAAVAAAMAAL